MHHPLPPEIDTARQQHPIGNQPSMRLLECQVASLPSSRFARRTKTRNFEPVADFMTHVPSGYAAKAACQAKLRVHRNQGSFFAPKLWQILGALGGILFRQSAAFFV